jgi:hypothetical protein
MMKKLASKMFYRQTTQKYVVNERAIKKAADASMKDQRDIVKRAQKLREASVRH